MVDAWIHNVFDIIYVYILAMYTEAEGTSWICVTGHVQRKQLSSNFANGQWSTLKKLVNANAEKSRHIPATLQ